QEGYAIEVFIEGGRSRTGKLLRPKLGMLEMALKALAVTPRRDLGILPTFIGYERVIEERSYVSESEGQKKKAEGVSNLLSAPKVLFHRYGRLNVRVGEFFAVQAVLDERGVTREQLRDGQVRREMAQEIGLRTLREINRNTVVTPSAVLATALLGLRGRRIAKNALVDRVLELVEFLAAQGAELDPMVASWSEGDDGRGAVDRTIAAFVRGGRMRVVTGDGESFEISEGQRLPLDYYKNNIIHLFAPSSIVLLSLLRASAAGATEESILEDVTLACRLYRWEFLWPEPSEERAAAEVLAMVREGFGPLVARGIVAERGGRYEVADAARAAAIADVLRNYHEVYLSALHAQRQRVLGEAAGDPARLVRLHFEKAVAEKRYVKPEGQSRINVQSALQSCKDLKLNRPPADERPYDEGGLGDRLIKLLESALG
ncbi:MAG: 1-acyl-sn-glycerol-3-phosphate acyltransferase, partial [Proteobacteria bacterium]|nr:1-acyl-sn-glycerol-3-phosphate acyltransferase [Pseudomonadota bacterium]